MIGSMIVGFLIGLIASAISNRGEHMGCIGKTFVGWLGAFVGVQGVAEFLVSGILGGIVARAVAKFLK